MSLQAAFALVPSAGAAFPFSADSVTPPILYGEPDELIQGDTWQWKIQSSVYPASDGWTLNYDVSGATFLTFAATTDVDGITYDVVVPYATTTVLAPGLYYWNAYVLATSGTYAGQKFTIRRGTFRITANFELAGPGAQQAFAEKMVRVLEAEIQARITGNGSAMQAYAIEGRSISKIDIDKLYTLRAKFQGELVRLSRGGRLPPLAITFGRRPAGYPAGAGDRSNAGGGYFGVE